MIRGLIHRFCFIIPLLTGFLLLAAPLSERERHQFSTPEGMELRVQFWINVFTRYSMNQVILHDSKYPERIYRVIDVESLKNDKKALRNKIKQEKETVRRGLKNLAAKGAYPGLMTPEEKRLWLLWGKEKNRSVYARAANRLRTQGGMKESFRDGIVRSGRYLPIIRDVFKREGLPLDLAYLCHVESSFHPGARSKVGATGLWQFTRGTGRQFMTVNSRVDERLDPILSTMAAAELMKENHAVLKSWPLAVTAYNHGLGGMKRAKARLRTTEMNTIIEKYRSRSFGFASKNFYAEFLAAVHVATNEARYYGKIEKEPPVDFKVMPLLQSMTLNQLAKTLNMEKPELVALNPAWLKPVRKGTHRIPSGYRCRLPRHICIPSEFAALNPAEPIQTRLVSHQPKENVQSAEVFVKHALPHKEESKSRSQAVVDVVLQTSKEAKSLPSIPLSVKTNCSDIQPKPLAEKPHPLSMDRLHEQLAVSNKRIVVQPDETLGHYADWLSIPTQTLRRLNGLRYRQKIRIGQRIQLSFYAVDEQTFSRRRLAYHQAIVSQYFETHQVTQAVEHRVQKGESLWSVAKKRFDVPLWLVLAYNSWEAPRRLSPGDMIRVPVVEQL